MLGLYDDEGDLQSVGVGEFHDGAPGELVRLPAPYVLTDADEHPWSAWREAEAHEGQRPGAVSLERPGPINPLRPELVVRGRLRRDGGTRFRHTTQFKRWRPDRDPRSCAENSSSARCAATTSTTSSGADPGGRQLRRRLSVAVHVLAVHLVEGGDAHDDHETR